MNEIKLMIALFATINTEKDFFVLSDNGSLGKLELKAGEGKTVNANVRKIIDTGKG
jgi:hypothetical protein